MTGEMKKEDEKAFIASMIKGYLKKRDEYAKRMRHFIHVVMTRPFSEDFKVMLNLAGEARENLMTHHDGIEKMPPKLKQKLIKEYEHCITG